MESPCREGCEDSLRNVTSHMKRDHKGGTELLVVQYCREDADFNQKNHQDQTKNAKVMRFQNFPNFTNNFTQFLGYTVGSGENF